MLAPRTESHLDVRGLSPLSALGNACRRAGFEEFLRVKSVAVSLK
jgi:hypothetical protein